MLDAEGKVHILGRRSELINVGGEKVHPTEIAYDATALSSKPGKVTMISAQQAAAYYDPKQSSGAYPTRDAFLADIVDLSRREVEELVRLGCTYIQIDGPQYGALLDAKMREGYRQRGSDPEKLIDLCAQPAVQRIIFVEAPQVVGPEAWRKIELRYAFGTLRSVLAAMRDAKIIKPYPVDLIARTLLALLHESSAELARSRHDPKIRTQISDLVAGVLDVFLVR